MVIKNTATMKLYLQLNAPDGSDEIHELHDYLREQNLKGMVTNVPQAPPVPGSMSGGAYMSIINVLLGSTVVSAGVKGLFDILKGYFDWKKQGSSEKKTAEKISEDAHKMEFVIESSDGKKLSVKLNSFNEKEREAVFQLVDKALATK